MWDMAVFFSLGAVYFYKCYLCHLKQIQVIQKALTLIDKSSYSNLGVDSTSLTSCVQTLDS